MLRFKSFVLKPIAIEGTGGSFPARKGIRRVCHNINFLLNGRVKTSFEVGEKTDGIPSRVVFVFLETNNVIINGSVSLSDFGKFQLSGLLFVDVTKRSTEVGGKDSPSGEGRGEIFVEFSFGPSSR